MIFSPENLAFALRNLLRHRARTLATLAAISIGIASLILAGGFVKDIFIQLGEATIHSQTGHIQLAQSGFWETHTRAPETHMIHQPEETKKILANIPGVEQVVTRINFSGMLNNGKRDLGVIGDGIEANGEEKIGSFVHYTEGRALSNADTDGIVIGQGVARTLNLKVGDSVTLVINLSQGAVNTAEFKVTGVFQSFSKEFDSRAVRIPLNSTRELFDTNDAHLLVMTLSDTKETEPIARITSEQTKKLGLEVKTWKQLSDFYEKTVQLYDAQFGVLRLIIFFMVLLSVTNSINMTLYERTKEFGTMLALGNTPGQVTKLIMTESCLLGLFGAILGISIGCIGAVSISTIGISMPPPPNSNLGYTAQIRLDFLLVLSSGLLGLGATVIASILPARRAAKLDVVEALRHGI